MKFLSPLFRNALMLVVASFATTSIAQSEAEPSGSIVVIGKRTELAEAAAEQAKEITLRPLGQNPLPRQYAPICIKIFGIDPAYGLAIAERIRQNMKILGLTVGKPRCQPNVWIGFAQDSKVQVARLRKEQPAMFDTLTTVDIDRVFGGSGAAQVWNATEMRSADGRPMTIVEIDDPRLARKIVVKTNPQYQGGRLVSPIRIDINGTIVIFDNAHAAGKTVQQLADYATFRILAPVQDYAEVPERALPTILTLFTPDADPPAGLTEFDWAYLSAYYKLDRGAKASAVHDATRQAVLDGTGQTLSEKAAGK